MVSSLVRPAVSVSTPRTRRSRRPAMVSRAASSRNALCVERYALCVTRTAPRCKPRGCFFFRFFAEFGIGGVLGLGILAKETVASPRRPHRRRLCGCFECTGCNGSAPRARRHSARHEPGRSSLTTTSGASWRRSSTGVLLTKHRPGSLSPESFDRTEQRSEEHTSELQSPYEIVCRLLREKKKQNNS